MVKGAKALELWCARVTAGYHGVNVSNMSSAWRDGLAFCAIIHRYRPDLIDFEKLDKKDVKGNCALAFRVAEEKLGIPMLLDPEDMAACSSPDRLSILTYVSEYYHKFNKLTPNGSNKQKQLTLRRQNSTDSAGMSVTPPSSSGSSTCDSPPPASSGGSPAKSEEINAGAASTGNNDDQKKVDEVVQRRKRRERSLASRRLVQSMFLESTGGISSLVNSSADEGSPASPEMERENPFREAMMKFAALEKEKEEKEKSTRRSSVSKATETLPTPDLDTKATQTTGRLSRMQQPGAPFRSVLKTQISCPMGRATSAGPRARQSPNQTNKSLNGCNMNPSLLSYTSTPKPYSAGQINRSLSLGQSLHQMSLTSVEVPQCAGEDHTMMTQSFHDQLPINGQQPQVRRHSKCNGRPASMYHPSSSAQNLQQVGAPIPFYNHRPLPQHHQPPLIWRQSTSSSYSSNPSLHHENYPKGRSFMGGSGPIRERHLVGIYDFRHHQPKLHTEGQSSLV